MAGYSGTPLPKKLGINEGSRVALVGAYPAFKETLGELPPGVQFVDPQTGAVDVIVCFATNPADVAQRFLELKRLLAFTGGLWIAWPKKARGVPVTLLENDVREIGLAAGLVDNKVCAIDERWSGLRFVYRLADRPGKVATRQSFSRGPGARRHRGRGGSSGSTFRRRGLRSNEARRQNPNATWPGTWLARWL